DGVCLLQRDVQLDQAPQNVSRAELVATAHGIYEARVNSSAASDSLFEPGWTTYESRLQVQRYDVTYANRAGTEKATIEVKLGRGWWAGDFGFKDADANYGDNLAFIGMLSILYEDGAEQLVPTDMNWSVAETSIVFATIYDGQHEDRTLKP